MCNEKGINLTLVSLPYHYNYLKKVEDSAEQASEDVPHGDDPIGDPDEERAPSEEAIKAEDD